MSQLCGIKIIRPVTSLGNDRIIVVELSPMNKRKIFIIGVYLPQRACVIDSFDQSVEVLDYAIWYCMSRGDVIIIGDYNCHYGMEYGERCWGITTRNATYLHRTLQRQIVVW